MPMLLRSTNEKPSRRTRGQVLPQGAQLQSVDVEKDRVPEPAQILGDLIGDLSGDFASDLCQLVHALVDLPDKTRRQLVDEFRTIVSQKKGR